MKLNVFNRKKTALEKLTSTYDVKLDASASQLIMDVLAKLYDNPVEAAIREYVSNAYDANVEAGPTEPVHLHVPTEDEPYLEVSDTSNCLDDVYDFVLPNNNDNVIIATTYTDGIDWILRNKPNITYFSKSNMDAYAQDIRTIIEPVLVNDNAVYLLRTIIKNKQLSSNISMLNLDTKQDTETYLAALHKATRRIEPKTHNLSFDQKVFLAALVSRDRKFLSKKDAHKIIKRLKLLFPDELKLIKDCADEIVNKVQL